MRQQHTKNASLLTCQSEGPGREEFLSCRCALRRRRPRCVGEANRGPEGFRDPVPSAAMGAYRRRALGEEGTARPVALRRRVDAPVGRDRREGWIGCRCGSLCLTSQFDRPRPSRRLARAIGRGVARYQLGNDRAALRGLHSRRHGRTGGSRGRTAHDSAGADRAARPFWRAGEGR